MGHLPVVISLVWAYIGDYHVGPVSAMMLWDNTLVRLQQLALFVWIITIFCLVHIQAAGSTPVTQSLSVVHAGYSHNLYIGVLQEAIGRSSWLVMEERCHLGGEFGLL